MERRLFLTGLIGVAGVTGIAAVLPRQALAAVPMGPTPQPNSVLPDLSAPADEPIEPGVEELNEQNELGELDEGVQLAYHRRRRRVRRWRRRCRRYPHWVTIWISI